jgi:hypothetical protein
LKTHDIPENFCLNCGYTICGATSAGNNDSPKDGSFAICFMCGHVMAFTKTRYLREITDEEALGTSNNQVIMEIQKSRGYVRNVSQKKNQT